MSDRSEWNPDPGGVDENTTYQLLQECWWRADHLLKQDATSDTARRELALAKTAIEDAQTRYAKGYILARTTAAGRSEAQHAHLHPDAEERGRS